MGALLAFGIYHGSSSVLTNIRCQVLHKEDLGDFSRCYTGLGKQHDRAGSQGGRTGGFGRFLFGRRWYLSISQEAWTFFPVSFKGCVAIGDFCWCIYFFEKRNMSNRGFGVCFFHTCVLFSFA